MKKTKIYIGKTLISALESIFSWGESQMKEFKIIK